MECLCQELVDKFKEYLVLLFEHEENVITPYIHIICGHLVEIQKRNRIVIGYFQGGGIC